MFGKGKTGAPYFIDFGNSEEGIRIRGGNELGDRVQLPPGNYAHDTFPLPACVGFFNVKHSSAGVFRKDMGDGCWMEFNGGTLTIKANKIILDADTVEVTGDIEGSGTIKGMTVDGCSGCGG